jgi:hypothetical protein
VAQNRIVRRFGSSGVALIIMESQENRDRLFLTSSAVPPWAM